MSQFQLFDSTEHSLQVALLIFKHKGGQSLKHQGHIKHQHCVIGRHVTGLDVGTSERQSYTSPPHCRMKHKPLISFYLQKHLFALLQFATFEERTCEVKQHLCVLIFVKLLQAVLVLSDREKKNLNGKSKGKTKTVTV